MNAYLRKKIEERAAVGDLISNVLEKCASENRDPSADEKAQLEGWSQRCAALDDEIGQLETRNRASRNFEQIVGRMAREDEAAEQRESRDRDKPKPETRSFGEQFVDSEQFRNYRGRGSMPPVEFEGFLEQREAISLATLDLPPVMWSGPREYTTTTPLLNVIGRERVSGNAVDYITWGGSDPLAAEVAEGELKPEAELEPTEHSVTLKTYAHWKAITRQALEDYPRIRSIVEGKLRGGLADALEQAAAATLTAVTAGIGVVTAADLMSGIRTGIGQVQAAGYSPNAVLLNPADFAALDIAAAAGANSGPSSFSSYWGLRPIAVGALDPGETYVGDFTNGLTWFDRGTTAVYMTDSHADYFVRNLLIVLAEQRAAFAVTEASALAKVEVAPETVQASAPTPAQSGK